MYKKIRYPSGILLATILLSELLYACGSDSSPEGRMSTRLEDVRQEMIDSLNKQNTAIRDSLRMIRKDLEQMRQSNR